MEYRYSRLVKPASHDKEGLCNGIPLRVHQDIDVEEAGIIRLRNDWRRYTGSLPLASLGGSMGPIYNFTSAIIPECHPSRLEIVSYVMELGFLHDDLIDASKDNELMASLNRNVNKLGGNGCLSGKEALQSKAVNEMMSIDTLQAKEMIAYWTKGVGLGLGRGQTQFFDFEDYLEYRVVDCGSFFVTALITFGMCLTIPPEEKEECFSLTRPAWAAAALTNDIQSWDKEYRLMKMQDKVNLVNGIWVLMKQYSIDVEKAKSLVVQRIQQSVADYLTNLKSIHTRNNLSLDSRRYIEATQYAVSGNLHWGMSTPRYHSDRSLTDSQIARMENAQLGHSAQPSTDQVGETHDTKN
ncbi:fusicoccadiene synthase [Xylaria sp. FL0933]|nr:fusicoccadiene synthase [Xylaria sp. FL0933]